MDENNNLSRIIHENRERLKELRCINTATAIIKENKSVEETLKHISLIMPEAWQYPDNTSAFISFDGKEYKSAAFQKSEIGRASCRERVFRAV
jgi:hypothetical protein